MTKEKIGMLVTEFFLNIDKEYRKYTVDKRSIDIHGSKVSFDITRLKQTYWRIQSLLHSC